MQKVKAKNRRNLPVATDTHIVVFEQLPSLGVFYSRVHIDRLEKAGKFPRHVAIGPARIGWLEHEVRDWLASYVVKRDAKPAPAPIVRRKLHA